MASPSATISGLPDLNTNWADYIEEQARGSVPQNIPCEAVRNLFAAAAAAGAPSQTTEPAIMADDLEKELEAKVSEKELVFKLFGDILTMCNSLKEVKEALENYPTEEEANELLKDLEWFLESLDFMSWQLGLIVGYETLAELRKTWGIQMSMHNVLQERYYKAQKTRYEDCKRGKGYFTQEDREFIENNKALNELHMAARWEASDCREIISDIIEVAFPDAPFDLGWDEHWVEA